MESLHSDEDELLVGYLELSSDIMFNKIPEHLKKELVVAAINIGKKTTRNVVEEFNSRNPFFIAQALGLKVVFSEENNKICNMVIHSEYSADTSEAFIYTRSLNRISEFISKEKLQEFFNINDVCAFFLGHEIFHHLENKKIGFISKKFPIKIKIGPFRRKVKIRSLDEIGANSFAKTLLNAKFSFRLLDFLSTQHGNQLLKDMQKRL
jgi:hypothetical protein